MALFLSNSVEINHHPEFKGDDLLEIKIIYSANRDSRGEASRMEENLGEFVLTKEAAIRLAKDILQRYRIYH